MNIDKIEISPSSATLADTCAASLIWSKKLLPKIKTGHSQNTANVGQIFHTWGEIDFDDTNKEMHEGEEWKK